MLASRDDLVPVGLKSSAGAISTTTFGGLTKTPMINVVRVARASAPRIYHLPTRPQVKRGYPLSLSISISGGKETNKDSPSNGERTGKSPA